MKRTAKLKYSYKTSWSLFVFCIVPSIVHEYNRDRPYIKLKQACRLASGTVFGDTEGTFSCKDGPRIVFYISCLFNLFEYFEIGFMPILHKYVKRFSLLSKN